MRRPKPCRTGAVGARTTRSARSTMSRREDIVKAASLIRTGKVFALGIPLDRNGPQTGLFGGRFNPIHQMLATGTDAVAGQQDWNKIRYADDTLMHVRARRATHWDALGHVFYEDKAYNGYDAKLIDSEGLNVLGIEHSEQDGRTRRAARHRALSRRAVAEGRREHLQRRARHMRQGAERVDRARRFRPHPHRPDGALPRREGVGRLCRRRRARRQIRKLLLVPGQADRRDLHRHLGRRGAAERDDARPTSRGTGW